MLEGSSKNLIRERLSKYERRRVNKRIARAAEPGGTKVRSQQTECMSKRTKAELERKLPYSHQIHTGARGNFEKWMCV